MGLNDMGRYFFILASFLLSLISTESRADDWERIVGADELRAFVSGATAEITLKSGVVARGEYYPDGTAKIEAWDEQEVGLSCRARKI